MARKYDVDDIGTRLAKHSSGGRSTIDIPEKLSMWKPKKSGSHTIDIVPFEVTKAHNRFRDTIRYSSPGKWYFERTYFVHFGVGVNNEAYVCPAKTFGHPCCLCEKRAELNKSPHKQDQDQARDLRPKDRQLFLIYDHDDTEKGIQLWDVSNWNFGRHLDIFISGSRPALQPKLRKFYSPTEGYTLRLTATEHEIGGGKNTEYTINEMYERERQFPDDFFDHGFNLDAIVREVDSATLKKIYEGVVEDPDDAPEEGDDPRQPDRSEAPSRNGNSHRDEEAPPAKKPPKSEDKGHKFATNDRVRFDMRNDGNMVEGVIETVNYDKQVATVKIPNRERASTVDFIDLELVESDDTFDLKDAGDGPKGDKKETVKAGGKGKNDRWGDDEDKPRSRK